MKNTQIINFKHFCMTIGELPTSYFESLSYYECLVWLCNYLENTVIPAINNNAEAVKELQGLFIELKKYVDNYFNSTDFQVLVNNKLDEMANDGTLANIINIDIFNNKVNIYNQNSEMNRIYRLLTSTYNHINSLHFFDNAIYIGIDNGTNSMLYKLNKINYNIISSCSIDFIITDICNYNNSIIVLNNSKTINSYDKDNLIFSGSINTDISIKYCELNNDLYYLVTSENEFKTTHNFINIYDYGLTIECSGLMIKNNEIYTLHNNYISLYSDKKIKRIYNQELIINNGFIKGISNAIARDGERIIIGTYKKLIPIRNDYVISLYEMNLTTNVQVIDKLLNYNSTRNEFEIYFDSLNTNVNPDGTIDNAFSNIYECLEVALNGNYTKGNIIFKNENEIIENLFISDCFKKLGLYFNNATIKGALFRNSSKIEVNNCNFDDKYLDNNYVVGVVNTDIIFTETVNFNNSNNLDNVLEATYKSIISVLNPITTGNMLSRSGSIINTRNNSLYDKKQLGDRFSKFMPNIVVLPPTNFKENESVTVDNLNYYSKILFRINCQGQFSLQEIPALNGTYYLSACITHNNKLYIGNLKVTINDNTITINTKTLYNITDNNIDTTLTFRVNNIFGIC